MTVTRKKRSDGTVAYRVRVELPPDPATGRRRWHSETIAPGRDAAKRASVREAELLAIVGRKQVQELGGRNVERYLVDDWLPYYRASVREQSWLIRERNVRLHILPTWGSKRLSDLQPLALQRWIDGMVARGLAPNTVIGVHATLGVALRQAERWELIARNPMPLVRRPVAVDAAMVVWTLDELRRFVDGESVLKWRALWAVLAGTGMRRGEVLALRWDDVDWERGSIRVDETITRDAKNRRTVGAPKTTAGRRTILVDDAVLRILRQHRAEQAERRLLYGGDWQPGDWVFDAGDGTMPSTQTVVKWFDRRVAAEGLPAATMHDVRHAHVTHLAAAGVPLAVIAQRVGHSGVDTLLRVYTHLSSEHQTAAVEALAGMFLGMRDSDVTRAG